MQVDTNVDEADIGRIRLGQRAAFTVDAFPGRTFSGEVIQIRKAPQVVQNVVTYNVVVGVQNPDGKLLPGMTANVRIVVDQKPSVLKIPNAALRFRPQSPATPEARPAAQPRAPHGEGPREKGQSKAWIVGPDGKPAAVPVTVGITDGTFTEVVDGDLKEGQELIVGSTERPARPPSSGPRLRF
jgi:HlyD family secretion protein